MKRASQTLAILVVALAGVWGCAQGPSAAAQAERLKALESKAARLETDFRSAATSRDQFKQTLTQAEEQIQKLQLVVKERDELKVALKVKTSERDQVVAQYESFRKSLRDLVGQAEAAVLKFPDGEPVIVTIAPRN
ncbi:MAG: hypothetical protein U0746_06420 [Gemmataceae bacterium]